MPEPLTLDEIAEELLAKEDVGDPTLFPSDDGVRNYTLNVTCDKIRVYIAMLLLTEYLTPKYVRMSREVKSGMQDDLAAASIRRNRFFVIQQYVHLPDSSSHISIDETILPYFRRHGTKQHIHGKRIRFGYKLWSAAMRHGYLVNCEPYQGSSNPGLKMQSNLGLGVAVILEFHSRSPQELGPYNLYFDNFFNGLPVLKYLREQNVEGTGTGRGNRLKNCNLPNSMDMKKESRGSSEILQLPKLRVLNIVGVPIMRPITSTHRLAD
ncbi:PiggyBac transposable element-derived protein 3 [Eumeta japonica]|uniref:PiggyBac transposable element-derived protein 3 n=1 Tax=Eumeta variegata TaxID=151549 RepID=A0A4C1WY00_EUMVA|nr:PiggyBac transposable element-derived protein 3 [Eumeta japonica]